MELQELYGLMDRFAASGLRLWSGNGRENGWRCAGNSL